MTPILLTTALLASPEQAIMEATTGPAFVAAGHVEPVEDDSRYNFAAGGLLHWNIYAGMAAIDRTTETMGTHWQFYLGFDAPVTDTISVSYRHLSNCSQICGWDEHLPNSGIDTLSLSMRF